MSDAEVERLFEERAGAEVKKSLIALVLTLASYDDKRRAALAFQRAWCDGYGSRSDDKLVAAARLVLESKPSMHGSYSLRSATYDRLKEALPDA